MRAIRLLARTVPIGLFGVPTIALSLLEALKMNLDQLRRSDHASFWDAGYPAVMLGDTGDFRNPHYHCAGGSDALADVDVEFATMNIKATVASVAAGLDR